MARYRWSAALRSRRRARRVGDVTAQQNDPRRDGPSSPTWTHVALRVADIDASIAWYERFTPLRLLDKRQDDLGFGAWLGQPESVDRPFVLVLAQFLPATDPYKEYPQEVLAPFAHLGIELPTRESLDEAARDAEAAGCLAHGTTADASADRLRVHAA